MTRAPVFLLAAAWIPSALPAQLRLELEPSLGVYTSFTAFEQPPYYGYAQHVGVALGGQATVWLSRRVGFRALVLSMASKLGPNDNSLFRPPTVPARLTVTGVQGVVKIYDSGINNRAFIACGVHGMRRSGDAYKALKGTSSVGGSLALGSQFRLTNRLSLQADVQSFLYALQLRDSADTYPRKTQLDMIAHLGLVVSVPARRQ